MPTRARHADRSWKVSRLLIPRAFPVDILVRTLLEIKQALTRGDFFYRRDYQTRPGVI